MVQEDFTKLYTGDMMDYFGTALKMGAGIVDKIPDYDQRRRKEYHELVRQFNNEITKDYEDRDDNIILNIREDAKLHWQEISSHLE